MGAGNRPDARTRLDRHPHASCPRPRFRDHSHHRRGNDAGATTDWTLAPAALPIHIPDLAPLLQLRQSLQRRLRLPRQSLTRHRTLRATTEGVSCHGESNSSPLPGLPELPHHRKHQRRRTGVSHPRPADRYRLDDDDHGSLPGVRSDYGLRHGPHGLGDALSGRHHPRGARHDVPKDTLPQRPSVTAKFTRPT